MLVKDLRWRFCRLWLDHICLLFWLFYLFSMAQKLLEQQLSRHALNLGFSLINFLMRCPHHAVVCHWLRLYRNFWFKGLFNFEFLFGRVKVGVVKIKLSVKYELSEVVLDPGEIFEGENAIAFIGYRDSWKHDLWINNTRQVGFDFSPDWSGRWLTKSMTFLRLALLLRS